MRSFSAVVRRGRGRGRGGSFVGTLAGLLAISKALTLLRSALDHDMVLISEVSV